MGRVCIWGSTISGKGADWDIKIIILMWLLKSKFSLYCISCEVNALSTKINAMASPTELNYRIFIINKCVHICMYIYKLYEEKRCVYIDIPQNKYISVANS